jgi:hypothetical protein
MVAVAFCVAYAVAALVLVRKDASAHTPQPDTGCPEEPSFPVKVLAYLVMPFVLAWRVMTMNPFRVLGTLAQGVIQYVVGPVVFCVVALAYGVQKLITALHVVDAGRWVVGALLEVATVVFGGISFVASWCGDLAKWAAGGAAWLCTELIVVVADSAAAVPPLLGKALLWLWQHVVNAAAIVFAVAGAALEVLWGVVVVVGSGAWEFVVLVAVQLYWAVSVVGSGAWTVLLATKSAAGAVFTMLMAGASVALGYLWSAVVYLVLALVAVITYVGTALADLAYLVYCSFDSAARYLVAVLVHVGGVVVSTSVQAVDEASNIVSRLIYSEPLPPLPQVGGGPTPSLK